MMFGRREVPVAPAPIWESTIKTLSKYHDTFAKNITDEYKIVVDVSDYSKEDVSINVDDENRIIVECTRSDTSDNANFQHVEKYIYSIPEKFDPETIRAEVADGELIITIKTKVEKSKGKEIEIKW